MWVVGVERHLREDFCFHVSHERFVLAIRGLLLGFRRDDSVISKTRAIGKTKCVVFLSEILMESACDRKIEIVFLCFAYQYS